MAGDSDTVKPFAAAPAGSCLEVITLPGCYYCHVASSTIFLLGIASEFDPGHLATVGPQFEAYANLVGKGGAKRLERWPATH